MLRYSTLKTIPYNLVRLWTLYELKQTSTFLVHSEGVKQVIIQNGFSSDRIEVLRPYLPLPDTWMTNPLLRGVGGRADPPLREAGGCAEPNNVILFVGKLASHKGIFDLVKAVSRIHNVTWKLVIIGDGGRKDDVRELLLDKGLLEKSAVRGRIPRKKLGEYYRNASVVVVPSRCPETFGFVGPEAMFFGKPVVAYDSGIQNEWLIDGKTGYLVRCGDIASLSEKIQLLLTDKDLATKLGENGRKRCSMFLNKQGHINKLIEIYERSIQLYRLNS